MTNQTNNEEPCEPCEKKKIYSTQFKEKPMQDTQTTQPYTTTQKIKSFGNAMVELITGKTQAAEDDIIKHNLGVCANCDDLKRFNELPKGADLGLFDSCGICGCYIKQKVKRLGKNWTCPAGKWLTENTQPENTQSENTEQENVSVL